MKINIIATDIKKRTPSSQYFSVPEGMKINNNTRADRSAKDTAVAVIQNLKDGIAPARGANNEERDDAISEDMENNNTDSGEGMPGADQMRDFMKIFGGGK